MAINGGHVAGDTGHVSDHNLQDTAIAAAATAAASAAAAAAAAAAAVTAEASRATTAEGSKAPLASPALTGIPTVPTAAPGTNTTQAASTAFVVAANATSVLLTGDQTIAGNKTFSGTTSGITKAMVGLGNVDNTSDVNKPVSTAQAAAIAASNPIGSVLYLAANYR